MMNKLTTQNIEFITQKIKRSNIKSNELREDLIDHFCCAIEEDLKKGLSFEAAYKQAYQNICPEGLDEIQSETLFLITYKKSNAMKLFLYTSAYLSTISLLVTFYFSITGKTGGNIALLVSSLIILFLFLPAFFLNRYKRELSKNISTKISHILGFLGGSLFFVSIILKICHWPGAKVGLISSLLLFSISYLPFLFFKMYKKSAT